MLKASLLSGFLSGFFLATLSGCFTSAWVLSAPIPKNRALIQERGSPLPSGRMAGATHVPLERAEGGDTPILTFWSDRGPVRLLLDTGAASAMVSPSLLQRLGLKSTRLSPEEFSLAGGGKDCDQLDLSQASLPELRLSFGRRETPALRLQGLQAFVLPVAALPRGVEGVLGVGSLRQVPFVVDPLLEKLFFGSAALEWRQKMPSPSEVLPLTWRLGVPVGGMRLQPGSAAQPQAFEALIDTGAEGLFLTHRLAAILRPLGTGEPARLVGVCGQQQVWRQRLMGIGLSPVVPPIQTVQAIVTSNPVFALLGVEAIAGQEVLRFRRQLWRLDAHPPRLELW